MARLRMHRRAGFSLIEMTLAITLTLLIFAMVVPFFRTQVRSIGDTAGRMDAQQNARYALNALDRELRVAGLGVVDKQPLLVQADKYAITFNADLVTLDVADPGAVYYNPSVVTSEATSLVPSQRVTLPWSARTYPDSTYYAGTLVSRAETISYWVSRDSTSGRSDEYILYRRINNGTPRVVTEGVIIPAGQPLFRYFRTDSTGQPMEIPQTSLPITHFAAIHGAANDTGPSAITDSIRIVRMRVSALYKDPRKGDIVRTVESSIRLLNAGMIKRTSCGEAPLAASVSASYVPGPPRGVRLTWSASLDQNNGEKDVERYALFKRRTTSTDWGEPFASRPATTSTYTLTDNAVSSGTWVYGLVAQDCSPANSPLTQSTVTVP